jgi:hypothetical protein
MWVLLPPFLMLRPPLTHTKLSLWFKTSAPLPPSSFAARSCTEPSSPVMLPLMHMPTAVPSSVVSSSSAQARLLFLPHGFCQCPSPISLWLRQADAVCVEVSTLRAAPLSSATVNRMTQSSMEPRRSPPESLLMSPRGGLIVDSEI